MEKNIVFLYLNGLHQLFHTSMTAFELSSMQKDYKVKLIACHTDHYNILQSMKEYYPKSNCEIILLPATFRYKYLNFKKKTYPSPHSTIKMVKQYLNNTSAVVSTSHDLPKLLNKINCNHILKIYQYHGCGDRSYSFDPEYKNFNLLLIPGVYHKKRIIEEKIISQLKIRIVGYPKLDIPYKLNKIKTEFFKNNNPIVFYTPHWDPALSSYKDWSSKIIDYFKSHKEYNLIFAPHIQLIHWKYKYKYDVSFSNLKENNILVDYGSINSVNGFYSLISDIYIGDVSSQVYEFLSHKPRSCIFLNPNLFSWKKNPDFRFWELGEVIEDFTNFDKILEKSLNANSYASFQSNRISEYISDEKGKPSQRAAKAIYDFIKDT